MTRIILMCFDLSNRDSLLALNLWSEAIKEVADKKSLTCFKILVGLKSEIAMIDEYEIIKIQKEIDAEKYFSISAKNNTGIDELFDYIHLLLNNDSVIESNKNCD